MRQNIVQLEKFYASRLGRAAQSMALRRLQSVWPDMSGRDLLGFGYCWPYLNRHSHPAKRVILAMPGGQGAVAQRDSIQRADAPEGGGVISCLTHERILPFSDGQFDNVLVAHGAEETADLDELLKELWRITRPEGRIVVIAANRAGLWARSDKGPFGAGRPFSRTQLRVALSRAGFIPTVWSGALYVPPIRFLCKPAVIQSFEQFGETVWPGFSGLVLVEAVKRLYAEPHEAEKRHVILPGLTPNPIGKTAAPRH